MAAWGWARHMMCGEKQERGITIGHKENLGSDEYVHYLDCGMISGV